MRSLTGIIECLSEFYHVYVKDERISQRLERCVSIGILMRLILKASSSLGYLNARKSLL